MSNLPTLDLQAPASAEAEAALIGACLIEPRMIDECVAVVSQSDFYLLKHQMLWRALIDLHHDRAPIDAITVGNWLDRNKALEAVGGAPYLTRLMLDMVSIDDAPFYALIVQRASLRRRLMKLSDEMKVLAKDETTDTETVLAAVAGKFADLHLTGGRDAFVSIADAAQSEWNRLEAILNGETLPSIPTSLTVLRSWIKGYRRGELITIAARPGVGKTSMMQTEAIYQARKGYRVIYACLEQDPTEITRGLICIAGGLPYDDVTEALNLTAAQVSRYAEAQGEIASLPIWFADQDRLTPSILAAKVKTAIVRYQADIVFVDYFGLMEGDSRSDSRAQELAMMSRQMKQIARSSKLPIVVASQLNRGSEQSADRKPTLINLQGSDGLSFDSDVLIALWLDSDVDRPQGEGLILTNIAVLKNRNGKQGEGVIGLKIPSKSFVDVRREDMKS